MGRAMAGLDWASTTLGPVERWSPTLRTLVGLCLTSQAPTMVVWGPEHIQLYNDALAQMIGPKHPGALGRPYAETFAEIWDDLQGPLLRKVYEDGESVYVEDSPVFFHRRVPNEEMFWTFSWSPVRDDEGQIAGAFHPAADVTGRVVLERRLRLLRDLASSAGQATTVQDCLERAALVLSAAPEDVPFCAFYVPEIGHEAGVPTAAHLAAACGIRMPAAVLPVEVDLVPSSFSRWPLTAAAETGEAQVVDDLDLSGVEFDGAAWPETPSAAVVLPIARPDRPAPAALLVAGVSPRRAVDAEHLDFLRLLAGQLATALSTARLFENQHRVALTLQRSMLPQSGGVFGLDVAARYLPGSTEVEVGGDWYDVINLPAGRTAVVIGDVMGRGVRAAAVMGQLRAAVRAYSQMDLSPERVLDLLDRLVEEMSTGATVGQIVTCIYAVYDSAEQSLVLANAGHPPAVRLSADGDVTSMDGPVGPPLGVGVHDYQSETLPFADGDGLLLYTDGLVEARGESLDRGLDRLLHAVGQVNDGDLERVADAALTARASQRRTDDIAVLAVRVPTSSDDRVRGHLVELRGVPRAARVARRAVDRMLTAWGLPEPFVKSAVLVAAELVTNAVTHTPGPRQLRLRLLPDRVVVEVTDADERPPRRLSADVGAEGGRGLTIVSALASDWGVRPLGSGKVVWAELAVDLP